MYVRKKIWPRREGPVPPSEDKSQRDNLPLQNLQKSEKIQTRSSASSGHHTRAPRWKPHPTEPQEIRAHSCRDPWERERPAAGASRNKNEQQQKPLAAEAPNSRILPEKMSEEEIRRRKIPTETQGKFEGQ